jgi:hypothetical protein
MIKSKSIPIQKNEQVINQEIKQINEDVRKSSDPSDPHPPTSDPSQSSSFGVYGAVSIH